MLITIAVLKVYWVSVRKFGCKEIKCKEILDRWLRENTHNVRNFHEISNENRKTVKYGIETISTIIFFRVYLTNEYKLATYLHHFKLELKNRHCDKFVRVMPKFSAKYGIFIKLLTSKISERKLKRVWNVIFLFFYYLY